MTDTSFSQEVQDTVLKLATAFSFVKGGKFFSVENNEVMTADKASDAILSKFAVTNSTLFTTVADSKTALKEYIQETIKGLAKAKKNSAKKRIESETSSGHYSSSLISKVQTNSMLRPKTEFNEIDAAWCAGLYYYSDRAELYAKNENGSLTLVDTVNTASIPTISLKLAKRIPVENVHTFLEDQFKDLTSLILLIRGKEVDGIDAILGMPMGESTVREVLEITETPKDIDSIQAAAVYYYLNHRMPASIFAGPCKVIMSADTFSDDEGNQKQTAIQRITYGTESRAYMTGSKYFENILRSYIGSLPQLNNPPVPVKRVDCDESIIDRPYYGIFNEELYNADKVKYSGLKFSDSHLVKPYLTGMDKEQTMFVCAWWYNTFMAHKSTAAPSLLDWNRGGTMKNTNANMVRFAMQRYFGTDCCFSLKQDQLTNDANFYNSATKKTLPDAVWCHYDEVAVKGATWDTFKTMSGGTTMHISVKKLYSNPYTVDSKILFYFASNKNVYLTDKEPFQRRLAIVHTKAQNTWIGISQEDLAAINNDDDTRLREFFLLMSMGERAYNTLVEQYGSLVNASMSIKSIASELEECSAWDEYLEGFYDSLFDSKAESITISNSDLIMKFTEYKRRVVTTLNFEDYTIKNYCRSANDKNKDKMLRVQGHANPIRGWIYYRRPVDQSVETVDYESMNPTPEEIVLDYNHEHAKVYAKAPELPKETVLEPEQKTDMLFGE